jgi:hypothetical protein
MRERQVHLPDHHQPFGFDKWQAPEQGAFMRLSIAVSAPTPKAMVMIAMVDRSLWS